MSPAALRHFDALATGPRAMSIAAMRDDWYQKLRAAGLIETGQEMSALSANFPDGPALVRPCLAVNPAVVWVRLSPQGLKLHKENSR